MNNINDLISNIEKCAIELKKSHDKLVKTETFEEAKRRIIQESNDLEKIFAQNALESLNDELNKDFRDKFNAINTNHSEELTNLLTKEHYHKYYCCPEGEKGKEYEDRFQKGLGFLHALSIVQEYLNSNNGFASQIKQRSISISNVDRRNNRILEFYYKHIHNKFIEVNFPKIIVSTFYNNETITESACEKIESGYRESDGNVFDEIRLSVVIKNKKDIEELQDLLPIFKHSIREKQ